jgi:DNA-3-methyladenine glycosylase II
MLKTAAAHKVLKADPIMAHLIEKALHYEPDARIRQTPFEVLARAIAHQQLHATAARNILARFVALYDGTEFPLPQHVIETEEARLRGAGFSRAKAAALKDLAAKAVSGVVPARQALDDLGDEEIIERLTAVRGIGRWTVEMMLMFHMQRPDVLPVDDFGIRNGFRLAYGLKGMPTPKALAQFGERWKPFRSIAAWYLWRANDLAKQNLLPKKPRSPPQLALQKPPKARKKTRKKKLVARKARTKTATRRRHK